VHRELVDEAAAYIVQIGVADLPITRGHALEAVDLYRHLAETRPDAFLPDLAMSLGAMSRALGALGHQAEAAQTANQALELLAPFVELYPERFGPLAHAIETDELRYTKTANQLPC
jgi:hypothetical protein